MRLEPNRKLFVGLRIDNKMREQLYNCPPRDKAFVDGTNPDYLMQMRVVKPEAPKRTREQENAYRDRDPDEPEPREREETYLGKIVDAGTPAVSMDDLRRNILSILNRVAPGRHREDAIKVFAVVDDEAAVSLPGMSPDGDDEVPTSAADDPVGGGAPPASRFRDYY